jgi:trans-aconitate 2-methyltransferase
MSWDPTQYLKYSSERLRPALDLLARIPMAAPDTIVDVGCGAGNVTAFLVKRWPRARVIGVDNSKEMLEQARASVAGEGTREWIEADIATWTPRAPADVVYSNAALHWQYDHARLFPRIFDWVAPGGVLAVQMPDQLAAPSHVALAEVVASARWRDRLASRRGPSSVLPAAGYFRLLGDVAEHIDAWTTEYLHVLPASPDEGHPVVAWIKGSIMTPFLAALDADEARAFVGDVSARVAEAYPKLADGRVLYAFRRVFLVASRAIR